MSYKLCVKGVFERSQMRASVGGIMKHNGRWVRGFGSMIGLADPQTVELWAIYYGLRMAWEREMTSVVVFTERSDAIDLINNPDPAHHCFSSMRGMPQDFNEDCKLQELLQKALELLLKLLVDAGFLDKAIII
ncbi:hypothetical protein POM88_000178 [Heracleum sosnowskyi]|uniref:RNase H type-1 domain-containing protein n=1 Tax=Heracleum sosnowskyi TaxID=360622 RepID=A0AAD8JCI1_9APIA|nr:hypothetical protein POM88_000178 [Heracleum sosnowskyi]